MVARIWAAKITAYDAASQTVTIDDGTGAVSGVDVVGTFTPVVNAQALVISDGSTVVVIGQFEPPSSGGGGVTAHGALTGLANDDHPQYLTTAEGNAAYDVAGAASAAVAGHVGAADPHAVYLTQPEGDSRYDPDGSAAAAVSAHVLNADPHAQYLRIVDVLAGTGITITPAGAPNGTITISAPAAGGSGAAAGGQYWQTASQQLPSDGSWRGVLLQTEAAANDLGAVMNWAAHATAGLVFGATSKSGRYFVQASVGVAGNSAGDRRLQILKNAASVPSIFAGRVASIGAGATTSLSVMGIVSLQNGDTLRVEAAQTAGVVLDTAPNQTTLNVFYLGTGY